MQFTTNFSIEPSKHKIDLASKIMTLGSCFADHMGVAMQQHKLKVSVNPFGTTYHPAAIAQLLKYCLGTELPAADSYLEREGLFFHHSFHSSFRSKDKESLQILLQNTIAAQKNFLQETDFLILTLGTAFVYKKLDTGYLVNNCHKLPQQYFTKELLHVKHICQELGSVYHLLKQQNPAIKIVLTVSPVRHLKDGIPENQLSKAILRAACHYLSTDFEDMEYFPAYEIMMDELRDYRFYEADLIHPSSQAQQYIFQRFAQTYFSDDLQKFMAEWQKILKELAHRPFNEGTEAHQKFLKNIEQKLGQWNTVVDLSDELALLKKRIL